MLRYIFAIIFRSVLPVVLLISCAVRPCVISSVYGFLFLLWPFIHNVNECRTPKRTIVYLFVTALISCAAIVAQIVFYFSYPVSTTDPSSCIATGLNSDIWKTIGLQKLNPKDALAAARNIAPDLVTLVASILAVVIGFLCTGRNDATDLAENRPNSDGANSVPSPNVGANENAMHSAIQSPIDMAGHGNVETETHRTRHFVLLLLRISDILIVVLLALLVAVWPSILSAFYLIHFVVLITWWAIFAPIRRPCFNAFKISVLFYCALHLTILYWYQLWLQVPYFKNEWRSDLTSSKLLPKLIGLTPFINETKCEGFYPLIIERSASWSSCANIILLIIFYVYCSFQYKITRKGISSEGRTYNGIEINRDDGSSVHEELLGTENDEESAHTLGNKGIDQRDKASPNLNNNKNVDNDTCSFRRFLSAAFSPQRGQKHGRFVASAISFGVRHIYGLTLVSMMAWAITYHAWLSFVWLMTACLIWLLPDSRKWCLRLSPLFLLYAEILVSLQFVYGIRKAILGTFDENSWPDFIPIGLETPKSIACLPLIVKIIYTLPFVLTLRLYLRQRQHPQLTNSDPTVYGTFSVMVTEPVIAGSSFLGSMFVKYWIFVVGLVLLLISIRQPVVAYGVCYMAFFVVLITVLQISFRFWRFMLYAYLSILIAFSIAVLLLVYTYQFDKVPDFWENLTHWPDGRNSSLNVFKDLGLIKYESGSLFITLLTPISFLIVVCLQLKFFHAGFLRITNISALLQSNTPLDAVPDIGHHQKSSTTLAKFGRLLKYYFTETSDFTWRLFEIHIPKFVALALLLVALYEVNAVNFFLVVLISVMLPCRRLSILISVIACLWSACIVLSRMMFQMTFVQMKAAELRPNECETFKNTSMNISKDSPKWAGFEKTDNIAHYLKSYVLVFILLTFQAIIFLRQRYRRVTLSKMTPAWGIVFPEVTRVNADESLTRCAQYLVNYCFYKFGVELTFVVMVIDIAIRLDVVALTYSIWLLFLFSLSRSLLSRFWYIFVLFMAVVLPLQYAICVGLPPAACLLYPWSEFEKINLIHWLYLPNYTPGPNPFVLIGDFFVLLFACCQLYVFRVESAYGANYEGGDNASIDISLQNAVPNFINYTKSYLDILKTFIFVYFQWITLAVVFVAGVSGISLFSLGYVLGAFIILWKGNDLYTQPMKSVKLRWYALIFYNISVITIKVFLQAIGCSFAKDICAIEPAGRILIQIFTLSCLRGVKQDVEKRCLPSFEEAELVYDAIIFGFVVFQLKIFASWYFRHTIVELNAERILSYRGAMLMNQLVKKDMREQQTKEQIIYDRLITKTNKIREKYVKRLAGTEIYEATTYATAKRAGDYYMFDYESDEEFLELEPPKDAIAPEITPGTQLRGVGPIQLAHIAITKDLNLKETVSAAEIADERRTQSDTEMVGQATSTAISTNAAADTPTVSRRKSKSTSEFERMTDVDASSLSKVTYDAKSADKKPDSCMVSVFKFLRYACVSVPDHCAFWFNKWSRDYRYVAYVLKKEKRVLKENLSQIQQQGTITNVKKVRETIFSGEFGQRIHLVKSESEIDSVEKEVHDFWLQHNVFVRFFISLFYLLLSHTELLCYIMVILDQMKNASIISLPLPFLVFFWGTLRSPRPPQFFWVTVITYTMFMVVVKFIAQFEFGGPAIPINAPLDARRIIGIERMSYYASWDVALLMVLFFHRNVLKTLGLWKDADCGQEYLSKASTEQPDVAKSEEPVAIEDISVFEKEVPKTADSIELQELVEEAGTSSTAAVKSEGTNVQSEIEDDKKCRKSCCARCIDFYKRLLNPTSRYIMDLYAYMFLCDVICFLILTFGYSSFGVAAGKSDYDAENADVVANIKSNKVPLGFVIMLVSLMILIIIDRGIYLRKNIITRLVFQHLLVLLVHGWIFFALPAITDRSIQFAAQLWYFVKCVYFLLSAWQIRNGYPSRIFGNLLTKKYNLLNYSLFTGFMAAPFLFELRTLIDWIWTDTCMPLFDFFTMENIYSVIYRIKCMRKMEKDYPVPKGIAKGAVVKYGMGCPILLLVILLVWLPLLLFALVNSIGVRSLPIQAKMVVSVEGYPPLYTMDVQKLSLQPMSQTEFDGLSIVKFEKDKQARTFLRDYTASDTLKVSFRSSSNTKWDISTPSLDALEEDLKNPVEMSIEYEFIRPRQNAAKEPIRQTTKYKHVLNSDARYDFIKILKNKSKNNSSDGVSVLRLYSPYVEIPPIGEIQPVKVLLYALTNESGPAENAYYGLDFALIGNDAAGYYWRIRSTNQTASDIYNHIMMTAFVDRMFPSAFDSITSGGIIGVYIVVVLAAGNVLRNLVVNKALDIIIAEMPNVDRILQLCMDIFLVREAKDFLLELDLFAKLLFLFRSPETLIKWTRPKRD